MYSYSSPVVAEVYKVISKIFAKSGGGRLVRRMLGQWLEVIE